jgi:hypothetical protein
MGLKGFDGDDKGQWTFRDFVASVSASGFYSLTTLVHQDTN